MNNSAATAQAVKITINAPAIRISISTAELKACSIARPGLFFSKNLNSPMDFEIIEELWGVIQDRKANPKKGSYTNRLLADEKLRFAKLKEELDEIEESIKSGKLGSEKDGAVWEVSDFLYHLLVLLAAEGIELDDVMKELRRRR